MRETKQRNLILEIINNSCDHLKAEDIYEISKKHISNISLGTVYRNLNYLYEFGSIRKIKSNDNIDHYDNINVKHNHFICSKCNKIYDVFESVLEINKIDCGIVMNYEKIYNGICNNCIKEEI